MKRKPGFYWVREKGCVEWIAAERLGEHWYLTGDETPYTDENFAEIYERRLIYEP